MVQRTADEVSADLRYLRNTEVGLHGQGRERPLLKVRNEGSLSSIGTAISEVKAIRKNSSEERAAQKRSSLASPPPNSRTSLSDGIVDPREDLLIGACASLLLADHSNMQHTDMDKETKLRSRAMPKPSSLRVTNLCGARNLPDGRGFQGTRSPPSPSGADKQTTLISPPSLKEDANLPGSTNGKPLNATSVSQHIFSDHNATPQFTSKRSVDNDLRQQSPRHDPSASVRDSKENAGSGFVERVGVNSRLMPPVSTEVGNPVFSGCGSVQILPQVTNQRTVAQRPLNQQTASLFATGNKSSCRIDVVVGRRFVSGC